MLSGFVSRLTSGFLLTIGLVIFVSSVCGAAPTKPGMRIHYQGRLADGTGKTWAHPTSVRLSLWLGGSADALNSGREIFSETTRISPAPDGTFNYWLGSGRTLSGSLANPGIGAGQALYVQASYRAGQDARVTRTFLYPIDNAWVGRSADWLTLRSHEIRSFQGPKPTPGASIRTRRGMATLYPDRTIQREDGTIFKCPKSTTAGVQELFDYCAKRHVDGYIVGGSTPGGGQVVYLCSSPVHVHPEQGFRLDTGAINLIFDASVGSAPGLTIDSCMMVDFRIRGQINYGGTTYGVAFHPTNLLPLDTFVGPTIVDSSFHITTVATRVNCVLFQGSINYSDFSFNEINGGGYGLHEASAEFSNNRITCKHVHNQETAAVRVDGGSRNVWEINTNPDALDPAGIDTAGSNDIWIANVTAKDKPGIILRPAAKGNQFLLMGLSGGFDNQATTPTNRFYAAPSPGDTGLKAGFAVDTPPIAPSGEAVVNRNPYPVSIMFLTPGSVSGWSITDVYGSSQAVQAPVSAGQCVQISPGEAIALSYAAEAPTWRWRAVP